MVDARTIAFYDSAADRYDNLTKSGAPDGDLRDFMALLPEGARVLDLGCGPARASVHMRAAGFDPDPVDASEGMVTLANEAHDIGARRMTFDGLDAEAEYDAVWANFSLLHAPRTDLPRHLAAIARALKPGGIFHIGMKTGDGDLRDGIDRFYTLVGVAELNGLVTDAGLTVIATREGEAKGCAGTIDPFVIMRARKNG
jgi:SAM-dependent methyltransferase